MSEALDRIVENYGSRRIRESLDGWQQRRALGEESEWFAEAHELLVQLDNAVGRSYPRLSDAIALLERKLVEQSLVEAWTFWHGSAGDPVEAVRSLRAFLCSSGAQAFFDPNGPDDPVVQYAQALLRALLDSDVAVPVFGEQHPLPSYLSDTLLAQHLSSYERFRTARGRVSSAGMDGP